mgnify:CR=1 FL=1
MEVRNIRFGIITSLAICSILFVAYPPELVLNTGVIFEDEALDRIESESITGDDQGGQLILTIKHDNGSSLTGDFDNIQKLMQLERGLLGSESNELSWDSEKIYVSKVETPITFWSDAFESRNRSLANSSKWADVLQPPIDGGWCGDNSTEAEKKAFESTLLLLPRNSNAGVACPAFPGANAEQPPDADEMMWLVWLGTVDGSKDTDWNQLNIWADKVSNNTEFEVDAVGINMLFAKSKVIAKNDLTNVLIPAIFVLTLVMMAILREWKITAVTLASVGVVVCAEVGLLTVLDKQLSIIDGIAFPIVLAVAVDGAFWYCKSSRTRDEVRSILFMALVTTIAAISLAFFSPIKAQRSLALVMCLGVFLSWLVTRFVLEDFYMEFRKDIAEINKVQSIEIPKKVAIWSWPVALVLLSSIAIISPNGVEVFDVNQFLPEDDPALDEFEVLKSKYIIASSTVSWVVIDIDGTSVDDYHSVVNFQNQLSDHPSIISFETGIVQSPLVFGISKASGEIDSPTIDSIAEFDTGSPLMSDHRLFNNNRTTGVAIALFIDGSNADAALVLMEDIQELMDSSNLSGNVGGDLMTGSSLARDFDESRVTQILAAGFAVYCVSYLVTNDSRRSIRIAIGTIAIGAAVDGLASMVGERGVSTAPAVLLGMGFAADYLSHASANHSTTREDNFARWGAAMTSISVFILLSFAIFPPAKNTGLLLSLSILFSVIIATCLAINPMRFQTDDFHSEE